MHTVELQNMDVGLTKYLFRSTYENDWLDILEYINVIATIFEPMEVLTDSKDDETEPVLATISESDDIYAIPESDVVIVRGLNKLFSSVKFQIVFLKDSDEIQIYISTDDLEKVMKKELKKEFADISQEECGHYLHGFADSLEIRASNLRAVKEATSKSLNLYIEALLQYDLLYGDCEESLMFKSNGLSFPLTEVVETLREQAKTPVNHEISKYTS